MHSKVILALVSLAAVGEAASSVSTTMTKVITNGSATYTKTITGEVDPSATTPTSGVSTREITVSNDDATYTKKITETYEPPVSSTTTHLTVKNSDATYTKTLTEAETTSDSDSSSSSSSSAGSSSSSSTDGALPGASVAFGLGAGSLAAVAAFLI